MADSTISDEIKCEICFEKKSASHGLCCVEQPTKLVRRHFTCVDCLPPYVESVCDDYRKLEKCNFGICCPVYQCPAPQWETEQIRSVLQGKALNKYIDTLVSVCSRSANSHQDASVLEDTTGNEHIVAGGVEFDAKMKDTARSIVNALNIRCPNHNCGHVLDPSPDGCCSMSCPHCGTYFCWLCLSIQRNSNICHQHLSKCSRNYSHDKGMFVSRGCMQAAHNETRAKRVQGLLIDHYLRLQPLALKYNATELKQCKEIVAILHRVRKELDDVGLNFNDVLSGSFDKTALLAEEGWRGFNPFNQRNINNNNRQYRRHHQIINDILAIGAQLIPLVITLAIIAGFAYILVINASTIFSAVGFIFQTVLDFVIAVLSFLRAHLFEWIKTIVLVGSGLAVVCTAMFFVFVRIVWPVGKWLFTNNNINWRYLYRNHGRIDQQIQRVEALDRGLRNYNHRNNNNQYNNQMKNNNNRQPAIRAGGANDLRNRGNRNMRR